MPRKHLRLSTDPLSPEDRSQLEPARRPEQKKSLLRHAVESAGEHIANWPTTLTFGLLPSLKERELHQERKERDLLDIRMRKNMDKELEKVRKGATF